VEFLTRTAFLTGVYIPIFSKLFKSHVVSEEQVRITGTYGLGKRDSKGQRLADFCNQNLTVVGKWRINCLLWWLKQDKRRRYTGLGTDNEKNCLYNVKNLSDIHFDHNLVLVEIDIKLKNPFRYAYRLR